MAVSGHKGRDVFDRYNIVSTKDVTAAMSNLELEGGRISERSCERKDFREKGETEQVIDNKKVGPVAQRLEQWTHNPLVQGSNPCGPTNEFSLHNLRGENR
jgi:hypothetical protein